MNWYKPAAKLHVWLIKGQKGVRVNVIHEVGALDLRVLPRVLAGRRTGVLAMVRWKGSGAGGVIFNLWAWVLVSGIVWLASTSLAYRLVASGIRARLAR